MAIAEEEKDEAVVADVVVVEDDDRCCELVRVQEYCPAEDAITSASPRPDVK